MSSFADSSPSKLELKGRNKHLPSGMRNSKAKNSILIFAALFLVAGLMAPQVGVHTARASLLDVIRALVTINPLEVDVSAPAEVEIGRVFRVEATAINKGENRIENAEAQIFIPEGLVVLRGDSVKQIGVIRGGKDKKVFWQVKGEEIGSYVITVRVSGILEGTEISDGDSMLVEITEEAPRGRRNLSELFRDFLNFFRR